ncbi:MAG: 7-cyano-7-deazaguanine synthase [Syntrophomonadaceae bacterium]|nr:7-cyano-7-deazaguanine synthase [Bacillota bacterium]
MDNVRQDWDVSISSKKEDSVVILSGGLDSVVLLHEVLAVKRKPLVTSFDYGQLHSKELDFAKYWVEKYSLTQHIIALPFIAAFGCNSALLNEQIILPSEHYTHESQKITVVPNRNMVMLSIAVSLAEAEGIDEVYYGAHRNDYTVYPDCRLEFVDALSRASELGTYTKVKVRAPFIHYTKAKVVTIGMIYKVDFTKTWSCYAGGEKHCGICATCQERREAFKIAGVLDPTEYK